MKTSRLGAAILAGVSVTMIGLTASPAFAASARELPAGSALYAIDCDSAPNQLYSLDTATAQATPVGVGTDPANGTCAGPGAWDTIGQKAYYVDWDGVDALRSMDVTTGVSQEVAPFATADGTAVSYVESIAIGLDGAAYAIAYGNLMSSGSALFSLDLSTGVLDYIADTGDMDGDFYSFSVNPSTGDFYVVDDEGAIASIDVTTGVQTPLGTVNLETDGDPLTDDNDIYALVIDSNGIMWMQNYGVYSDLWSLDLADIGGAAIQSGTIATDVADATTQFDTESLILAPAVVADAVVVPDTTVEPAATVTEEVAAEAPVLAETGVDEEQLGRFGFAGLITLLIGAGLVVAGRARRQARI